MSNLLPPNATKFEHDMDAAIARLGDVPVGVRDLWRAQTCPLDLLPWLAWSLSLDSWKPYWPESVQRERIKQSIKIQSIKGSVKSVRDVVASFGGNLSIKEWWQNTPRTQPYTFDILLTVGGVAPATAAYQQDIIDEVQRTKPVRSRFTLSAGVSASGDIGLHGALRGVVFTRLKLEE